MFQTQSRVFPLVATRLMVSLPIAGLFLMVPKLAHVGLHGGHGFAAGVGHPLGGAAALVGLGLAFG